MAPRRGVLMTRHELAGAGLVLLWALLWAGAIVGERLALVWLQVATGVLLLVGNALIFVALARADLPSWGRRPDGADTRRPEVSRFPLRIDVAHGSTAPPPAGGRALRLEASGMRRRRRRL